MSIVNDGSKMDVLDRLDAEFDLEKELTESAAEEGLNSETEGKKEEKSAKAPESRREFMSKLADERVARERKIEEEQIALTKESSLRSAIYKRTPLRGTAAAVETMTNKDGEQEVCVAVLLDSNVKVVIPFQELYTYNPIDLRHSNSKEGGPVDLTTEKGKREYMKRKLSFAEKMIGAEVTFQLLDVYPDGNIIIGIGSRAEAMRRTAARMFGGSSPRIKVGDVGEATITTVARHALAVEFNGVDVVIPQYRLSLRYMKFVFEKFHSGEKLKVKVREIEFDEDGNVKSLRLDHIACELADALDRNRMVSDGTRTKGIITNVYRFPGSRDINIYAWLPTLDLPAKVLSIDANEFGREIKSGDSVRVQVKGRDERGYIKCAALSHHGNGAMFNY